MTERTATERLRKLLDEHGVEYETNDNMGASETTWSGFTAYQLSPNTKLIMHPTPEQAIAATLGSGTCKITATSTNNLMHPDYMVKWYELSCGHSLTLKGEEKPKWCAVCGKAVER